jgi:predicted nucleic acid-binding Zn ribbon protein
MRCPECNTLSESGAASCASCGLLLLKLAQPEKKRRAEDYAGARRREADRTVFHCRFCGGEIPAKAIRCMHCSEIVNDDYFRDRATRLRARVNYASWVAYIFGLAALLVFRQVGLVSIGAGLLLSIIYYAIPAEPPELDETGVKKKRRFWSMIARQLRLERVSVPLPALRGKRLVFVGTPLIAAVVGYGANMLLLQQPMNDVLKQSASFRGMEVSAHYEYWVVPGVVVYDLKSVSVKQTPIDVHTAFLEFAKKLKEKKFSRVELSYQGVQKFSIDGASFSKLGDEYAKKNFEFVLKSFPGLFHSAKGKEVSPANGDALRQFHKQWYGEDWLTQSVKSAMF